MVIFPINSKFPSQFETGFILLSNFEEQNTRFKKIDSLNKNFK